MADNYGGFEKVLRLGEGRRVKRLAQQAAYISTLEPDFEQLSDAELAAKTVEFRERIENGQPLEEILFEAFAAVREAGRRALGMRHFDVQLMGGIALHEGDIAEMKTGEGKTLVATLPLYLNALPGHNVHLVTVNDYLAKRDMEWMSPVYNALGLRAGVHPQHDAGQRAQGGVRRRHHVRHELRVRLRLPARQHGDVARGDVTARPPVCDRGRGRLDPDRRGADAAHHLRRARDRREDLLRLRADREDARGRPGANRRPGRGRLRRRRLHLRREVQERVAAQGGDRQGRGGARDREPLRPAQRPAREPPDPGAQGRVALPPRRRVRRHGRRGEDRRRVHRPDHGGAPLVGRPPPGGRGEGARADQGGAHHARHDHAPELLPPLPEARRHDRYGQDRGEGVQGDLRPHRHRDPHERADGARRQARLHLQAQAGQVRRRAEGHQGALRDRPAGARRDDLRRGVRAPLAAHDAAGHPAQRPEREEPRARGRDHHGRRPRGRGHDRDEHGRPRRRHQARRGRARGRRPLRRRDGAPRGAAHRQPAPRPLGPPGRPRRDALLPVRRGRARAPVRRRPDLPDHRPLRAPRRRAHGVGDALEADRGRPEEGRGAELRLAQERPQVRRRHEHPADGHLRAAPARARGRGPVRGDQGLGGRARRVDRLRAHRGRPR